MTRTTTFLATAAVLVLTLTGCGGSTATPSGGSSASGAPTDAGFDLAAVQKCLEAAGLDDVLPSGVPSGMPSGRPSGAPSERPSDLPSDLPSGAPSDFAGGGGFGRFQDPDVQAALKACGIELPERPGQPAASPSSS